MRILLILLLFMNAFYIAIPYYDGMPKHHFYPLNHAYCVNAQTWFWVFSFHLFTMVIGYIMWREIPVYKKTTKAFFFILVYYVIEHLLNYESFQTVIFGCNFSSHIVTGAILLTVIIREDGDSIRNAFYSGYRRDLLWVKKNFSVCKRIASPEFTVWKNKKVSQ